MRVSRIPKYSIPPPQKHPYSGSSGPVAPRQWDGADPLALYTPPDLDPAAVCRRAVLPRCRIFPGGEAAGVDPLRIRAEDFRVGVKERGTKEDRDGDDRECGGCQRSRQFFSTPQKPSNSQLTLDLRTPILLRAAFCPRRWRAGRWWRCCRLATSRGQGFSYASHPPPCSISATSEPFSGPV